MSIRSRTPAAIVIFLGLLITACSAGTPQAEVPVLEEQTIYPTHTPNPNGTTQSGGFPGVYLPRHCWQEDEVETPYLLTHPDELGFVSVTDEVGCEADYSLEIGMHAEVIRLPESSEDVYGVSQYLRIFQFMESNPTTGQFGLWGQWIGDDRAHPHGPFNSIEGGLFIDDKMGRSRFPKYMASGATHLYSSQSDTGGGWGFYEKRIACPLLGRVTLSNSVIVPPNSIAFDENQDNHEEDGGIFLGTSWVALPIFGGAIREDNQAWGLQGGKLTWTFIVDTANYSGPLIAYVPEHWYRRIDLFNAREILDDVYEWDISDSIANVLASFVDGVVSKEQLFSAISQEEWYKMRPDSDDFEGAYWVRPEQTLGYSAAQPYLPTGNEMPLIPVFSEIDSDGRMFFKIFPPLVPNVNSMEPFVLNVQTFDVKLYNHFVDVFVAGSDLDSADTSFDGFGIPMQVEGWNEDQWDIVKFEKSSHPDDNVLQIRLPMLPRQVNGETEVMFDWGDVNLDKRGWSQYLELVGDDLVPVMEEEVPSKLRQLQYHTRRRTVSLAPHQLIENAEKNGVISMEEIVTVFPEAEEGIAPDFSCYTCEDPAKCDSNVTQTIIDDGSRISYQWFRFSDQPVFMSLAADYPNVYTEEYLDEIQGMIEVMHREWGSTRQFLERPTNLDPLHLVEIDHGLVVQPPPGMEYGWVPIVTQVEQPDGDWEIGIDVRESSVGGISLDY